MPQQKTTTCPMGRDVTNVGYPVRIAELLAALVTPSYIERVAVHSPEHIVQAKRAMRKAFTYQKEGRCFSLVEVLSTCPINWGQTPGEAVQWLNDTMIPYYPLRCFKEPDQPEGA
jgi:2-oxoglutarate ferredoxin oxidoreductase subunit beta